MQRCIRILRAGAIICRSARANEKLQASVRTVRRENIVPLHCDRIQPYNRAAAPKGHRGELQFYGFQGSYRYEDTRSHMCSIRRMLESVPYDLEERTDKNYLRSGWYRPERQREREKAPADLFRQVGGSSHRPRQNVCEALMCSSRSWRAVRETSSKSST